MKHRIGMAYLHPGVVRHEFMDSVIRVLRDDRYDITRAAKYSSADITRGRNQAVEWFLKTDLDYLWLVDTDMVFTPHVPEFLINQEVPISSALYYGQDEAGDTFPVVSMWHRDGVHIRKAVDTDFWNAQPTEVAGVGMGCCIIRRDVLEALGSDVLWPFAEVRQSTGQPTEDDITFCLRAKEHGFKTYVMGSCVVGHVKAHIVQG